jgi:hypothetical protein
MSKRLQVILNSEAWTLVEAVTEEANEGFQAGSISYSDTLAEMVLSSKVDVKSLQLKHTDFRRAMRNAAKGGMELDSVIKMLQELKSGQGAKRAAKTTSKEGGSDE